MALFRHLHGGHRHDSASGEAAAHQTSGNVIHWADRYDRTVGILLLGNAGAMRAMTADLAGLQPGDTVLDVGCGTGDLTLVAKARVGRAGRVFGIDAAPEMIEVAHRKATQSGAAIDFRVGVIESLAFPDQTMDVVLSSLMMHHLPEDLKRRGLAEIRRVLKPGGRLLIVDFKRPETSLARGLLTLLMHGGLHTGVQDLPAMLSELNFSCIETGNTSLPFLGFVRGAAS